MNSQEVAAQQFRQHILSILPVLQNAPSKLSKPFDKLIKSQKSVEDEYGAWESAVNAARASGNQVIVAALDQKVNIIPKYSLSRKH